MNERIKELAIKAGLLSADYNGFDSNRLTKSEEKFAELIVKETLQVARAGIEFGDGMEDAVYKYFGVQE